MCELCEDRVTTTLFLVPGAVSGTSKELNKDLGNAEGMLNSSD